MCGWVGPGVWRGGGHTGVPQRARGPWLTNMLSRQLASPADTNTDGGGGLTRKSITAADYTRIGCCGRKERERVQQPEDLRSPLLSASVCMCVRACKGRVRVLCFYF